MTDTRSTEALDVTLRDATPDDLDFVAWVMLTASRSHLPVGIWEYINGTDENHTLAFLKALATTETAHWCHLSRFVIALVNGEPAAALSGYDPESHGMAVLAPLIPGALEAAGVTAD